MNPQSPKTLELDTEELIQAAIDNNEGIIASNGAFSTTTGERNSRSPNDRFIVKESSTENSIDWGDVNKPFNEDKFNGLWHKVESYLSERETYISNIHVGAHEEHYLPVKVTTETAWHSLFARLIFICPNNHVKPTLTSFWHVVSEPHIHLWTFGSVQTDTQRRQGASD